MKTAYLLLVALTLSACGTMQSIVKSSFPYTATLTISHTADVGKEYSAMSTANSFDQNFAKGGNDAAYVNAVRIISAKLQSTDPSDFNIGQLASLQVYVSKIDGKGEEMVASRKNINPTIGNSLVLDIDNTHFLDEIVRESNVRVRLVYKLRNAIHTDVKLHLVMNIAAYPNK
ncbi:hypothetical protein [Mucilaginibacter boryungensis]|uniref:Lipoprotein n=1 Tax=Mucilaginibacter boryungensis TaxID=768480 RepID=A0ABR9XL99_9SPHI|nr:hypothetical protein [Mucilaginibacter boryungensis]MBE9667991.1 hypothetical protein [Mucilaginibacter boryungensis]